MADRSGIHYGQRRRLNVLRCFSLAVAALILVSDPLWPARSAARGAIETVGLVLVISAVLGRLWAMVYIGGRKNLELITGGPYAITRNPLYLFSTLGGVGVGLLFGSLMLAALIGIVVGRVLYLSSRGEAVVLKRRFGAAYERYAGRVPLFLPCPRLYERGRGGARLRPGLLVPVVRDALSFLLAVPAAQVVEHLRGLGLLPRLVLLL